MQFSDRLLKLCQSKGISQDELGDIIGVSGMTVYEWENGQSESDMDSIKAISDYFNVSLDYLMNGKTNNMRQNTEFEYISKTKINDLPLIHIHYGSGLKTAKGIIAIGNVAVGVIAIGLFSIGILSIGVITLGILALGSLALGWFALGGIGAGYIAIGGMVFGIYVFGGMAIGVYSAGGMAVASRVAIGDYARGNIAIGREVKGNITYIIGNQSCTIQEQGILETISGKYPKLNIKLVEKIIAFMK